MSIGKTFLLLLVGTTCVGSLAMASPLAEERIRVEQRMEKSEDLSIVAVYGMCCKTCAIGIGKKVRTLKFVNVNTPQGGIRIDKDHLLLEIQLKTGQKLDHEETVEAIRKAGYKPVRIYEQAEHGIEMTLVAEEE